MTWGALRLQLQTSAPGVSLDLIDEFLNGRYEQVLATTDWVGLRTHATIQTLAAYESAADTVDATVGSATVTGTGTAWTSALAGRRFYIPGDTVFYTIAAVGGVGALTLERPYEGIGTDPAGTVYSARGYVVMQNVYALPTECVSVVAALNPVTGQPLAVFSKDQLDRSVGQRPRLGDPSCYALYDDSPETASPVVHQIEFAPAPKYARGISVEYSKGAVGFDGTSTSNSPLPWVTHAVLLYGARADIAMHLGEQAKVRMYEAKFQEELARMLKVDHQQRRAKTALRMADRFTRHSLARVSR
jgi:hypothetical protein